MKTNQPQKNIPPGWQQVKLGDICDFKKGKGLPKDDLTNDGKYEAIHYGELFTKYHEKIENILSKTNNNKNVFLSKKNDILMPTSDVTPRGLSTASFINKDGVILGGDILVIRPKSNILHGLFFSNFVSSQKKEVIKLVSGTTVFHLYGSDMAKLRFCLPPLPEQNRIVSVLETWDKVIKNLNKKIEIKKQIKKGLTDQYVYKRKDCTEYFIEDLFELGRGRVIAKNEIETNPGNFPVYSSQTSNNGIFGSINTYDFEGEYLTWTTDGAHAGKVFYRKGKFNCTNVCGTAKLKPNLQANLYFICSYLNYITKNYVSYVGNPKLMNNVFGKIQIRLPNIKEQNEISDILIITDEEISKLEKKLSLVKEQKRYLLNNLITGTIRTPENLSIK